MSKIKECLGCGQKYDSNHCLNCGKRSNVRVDTNHTCRHTQKHEDK